MPPSCTCAVCRKRQRLLGMMASTAARCSTRWTTVVVSFGRRGAARTLLYAGHGGIRSLSTLGREKLRLGTSSAFGGAAEAVTLRGLSGELS